MNKPTKETRIRYQIRDKNDNTKKVLYSNYITYEKVEVDAEKNPIKSSISGAYEPRQNYLLKKNQEGNIVGTVYKNTNGSQKNENNYVKNLHHFLMDMREYCKNESTGEEFETCPPAPSVSEYLFASQDINNLIPKNQGIPIVDIEDLKCESEIGEGGNCPE